MTASPKKVSKGRSRVSNARAKGKVVAAMLFAADIDGRSIWGRRYRNLVDSIVSDMGGLHTLSELKLGLIRRVAALMIECEKLELPLARGEIADVDLLARLSSHMRRISETIGLERVTKTIEPTLAEIIREAQEAEAAQ